MGNCMRISKKESSTTQEGEEWDCLSPSPGEAAKSELSGGAGQGNTTFYGGGLSAKETEEAENTTENKKGTFLHPATTTGTEVKIKITKKQLEQLLSMVDAHGQPLTQVLTQLMNLGGGKETPPRSWRPALHSIPEAEVYE